MFRSLRDVESVGRGGVAENNGGGHQLNAFNRRLARRIGGRFLVLLAGIASVFCLVAGPAGASWAVYYEGTLAYNTWYNTPGYWSYTQNWVDGTSGVTYFARMRNSSGTVVAQGGGLSGVTVYYNGGQMVSPGCMHLKNGGGSTYTSCWAWY